MVCLIATGKSSGDSPFTMFLKGDSPFTMFLKGGGGKDFASILASSSTIEFDSFPTHAEARLSKIKSAACFS